MRALPVFLSTTLLGCAAAPGAVGHAVAATSLATLASLGQRAAGGCYASCAPGTHCNGATGFCDAAPCHDRCGPDERCVNGGFFDEHCEPKTRVLLETRKKSGETSSSWP
jgi:hypothetical protein